MRGSAGFSSSVNNVRLVSHALQLLGEHGVGGVRALERPEVSKVRLNRGELVRVAAGEKRGTCRRTHLVRIIRLELQAIGRECVDVRGDDRGIVEADAVVAKAAVTSVARCQQARAAARTAARRDSLINEQEDDVGGALLSSVGDVHGSKGKERGTRAPAHRPAEDDHTAGLTAIDEVSTDSRKTNRYTPPF